MVFIFKQKLFKIRPRQHKVNSTILHFVMSSPLIVTLIKLVQEEVVKSAAPRRRQFTPI